MAIILFDDNAHQTLLPLTYTRPVADLRIGILTIAEKWAKHLDTDYSFITKSCIDTRETVKWEDGNEYPLVKLEISHTSHPFYTGKMKLVDTAGRIDKFRTRYNK